MNTNLNSLIPFILLVQGIFFLFKSAIWNFVPDSSDKIFECAFAGLVCLGLYKIIQLLEKIYNKGN